ncbi:hypothetical protein [Pseudoalteromonas sp. J010]|uniref:hypothetical protein n=1 Tax=Pseudoalteromonas sp. J010 TaxID=998465 RepID=UPI0023B92C7E|nr:hypothetical protein [Pseudoalteromonas sp. J010]
MQIKRYHQSYNGTLSHVNFAMYCRRRKVNSDLDLYGGGEEGDFGPVCPTFSGLYLRGGGLRYRIIKNWRGNVNYHEGQTMDEREIDTVVTNTASVRWYAEPIPFAERLAPTLSTIPYANHPYTPPTA